ncbi:MAG: hypothetical protein ACKV2Q_24830 [Planctomycetaceae bacterium]
MHNQYSIYTLILGGAALRHLEDAPFDPAIEEALVRGAGSLFPLDQFVASQKSKFQIKTHDLFRLFDSGELAIPLAAGKALGTGSPSYYQYRKRGEADFVDITTAAHLRLKSFNGTIWLNSLETAQDDKKLATADLTHHCLTDNSGNYVVAETNVALTGTPAMSNGGYKLGPLYIDKSGTATLMEGNSKFRYDSKLVYQDSPDAGKTRARQGAMMSANPSMAFTCKHLPRLITFGGGEVKQVLVENVTQYLQAIDDDGYEVAPGTPSHIAINFPVAKLSPARVNAGSESADAVLDYMATLIWPDQTVPVIGLTVGTVIP